MNIIAGFFSHFPRREGLTSSRRYSCYHNQRKQWFVKDNKKEKTVAGPYHTYEEAKGKREYLNDQDIQKRRRMKKIAKAALVGAGGLVSGMTFRFGGKEKPQPKMLTASLNTVVLDKGHEQVLFQENLGKKNKENKHVV